ncbi:xanthine dehydrogenase family protein molybdopterin-binding subunit (plasmid) [Hymenobacter tibetensis]|uniref:Xanthine dehydrogenase family protein molybdopterin-binding subunit n=1 Tax=Hymenobacter tibetensis TaxID=497967 RepID=A0ABY4D8E0_9BACT|nr:xanthine dehydrogenase family protein molybdopterin-binding subunit [Hymenobacter tibetensis]UOG77501.1 xanthine dehydrogenase family protein molybdopterin-binding subunit [Hymenobacter tibetensis]
MQATGKPLDRVDGRLKVTGAARYTAEWEVPGLVYGAVVDSARAHGMVRAIDTSVARKAPGVLAVLTHDNAPRLQPIPNKVGGTQFRGEGGITETRQPLQNAAVEYAGQPLAVVVADTHERARYAATLVRVTYDEQPPELAMASASRQTQPESFLGNKEEKLQVTIGDPNTALAAAPVKLKQVYESAITHHNPIEQLATIARWETRNGADFLTLYDTTRGLEVLQEVMATSLGLPQESVHIICPFIGGAFGSKGWLYAPPLLTAMAARVVGRPVKIEWRRQDMFAVAGQRAATRQTLSLGATRDGKITALRHDTLTHSSQSSGFTEPCARVSRMMYAVPNMGFTHQLAHLHLPSPCPMRGPGETVGGWALECALDELATELKLDPVELRLRNYADQNPENGKPWSSKHLRECYVRGRQLIGWDTRNPRPRSMRDGSQLVGYGMATTMYPAGRKEAKARATIFADGRALVQSATHELGNGAYTIFRQISADALALPIEQVRFELGDSSLPSAPTTGGSTTTATVGPAAQAAARAALEALKILAVRDAQSPLFGVAATAIEAREGRLVLTANPAKSETYSAILSRAKLPSVVATDGAKPGEERDKYSFYSFGAVFAQVRVDEASGSIRVARLCGVYDVGRLMNPQTAHSQIIGGMAMGVGAALMEATHYDSRNGRAVVRNLADYHVPSMADTPDLLVEWLNIPDPHISELGARGIGEIGCVGTAAAITNAVFHATGQRLRSLPLTPDKLLRT